MSLPLVVNLGLPKTGTTTLARALRAVGYKTADHHIRPRQTRHASLQNQFVADLIYKGYFETGDPLALLERFTAMTEISLLGQGRSLWPQMDAALVDAIRRHHPGVKFLASNRDSFKLSQSMLAWKDMGERLAQGAIPGLPAGYGHTTKERTQWIEGHYATLRRAFKGDADFLEYHVEDEDTRARISAFLGVDLPWWGKSNVNPMSAA